MLDNGAFGAGDWLSIHGKEGGRSRFGQDDRRDLVSCRRHPHRSDFRRPHHGLVVHDERVEAALIQHADEMVRGRELQIVAEILHLAAINHIPSGFRGVRLCADVCVMLAVRSEHDVRRLPTPGFRLAVHHHPMV